MAEHDDLNTLIGELEEASTSDFMQTALAARRELRTLYILRDLAGAVGNGGSAPVDLTALTSRVETLEKSVDELNSDVAREVSNIGERIGALENANALDMSGFLKTPAPTEPGTTEAPKSDDPA